MIGEILVNRYELLEKVGEGGMALVYRAKDTLLNRTVAVKVLRPQFANDEEFIERFRREAQSAASLSHPNVVNIYDVGHIGDVHFIVMEYVQGRNLNEVIKEHQELGEDYVIDVALQIAQALAHAHQHQIIHRDIKPHNILLTRDGRVKVTDFGIAQAVSSANLTQTGMVLGSVHYFSPEQARGNNVGSKTDLYSLGIVMYQMLTGRVPFRGDTAISVALKQIQENPVAIREINPSISGELERLVLRLLAKKPEDRPDDAGEVATKLRLLEQKRQGMEGLYRQDETRKLPVVEDTEEEVEEEVPSQKKTRKKTKRKQRKRGLYYTFIVLALMVAVGWTAQRVIPRLLFPDEVQVPNIVGLSRDEAERTLGERGLSLGIDREVFDNEIPENHIISQDPSPGRTVKQNRVIFVRLSRGAEYVDMPDVVGLTLREARLNLTQAGFTLGEQMETFEPNMAVNQVVDQSPEAGERVQKGIPVNLVVNQGRETTQVVTLPDFQGQDLERVRREVSRLGLELGNTWPEFSTEFAENQVIAQNPPPGTEVEEGWAIDVVYSQGTPRGAAPPDQDEDEIRRWTEQSQWESVEVQINVPEGQSQEVVILVIDDFGAREVYRETQAGGTSVVRTVQGRGEGAKIQVYIGGRMFLDEFFRDLN